MSPAQQSMVDLAETLYKIDGIFQVDITLSELEKSVEDFKLTIDGFGLDYEEIRGDINDFGAVIRNIESMTSRQVLSTEDDKLSASMLVLARHVDSNVEDIKQISDEFNDALKLMRARRS
jgi:hypothetical protein